MFVTHFYENGTHVLTQLLEQVPSAGADIKIKGKKGKVIQTHFVNENRADVYIAFEKIVKKRRSITDRRRR